MSSENVSDDEEDADHHSNKEDSDGFSADSQSGVSFPSF
jgi:hypothetical protein